MRILGARIFSKSFGGKIGAIWTEVTMRELKENIWLGIPMQKREQVLNNKFNEDL